MARDMRMDMLMAILVGIMARNTGAINTKAITIEFAGLAEYHQVWLVAVAAGLLPAFVVDFAWSHEVIQGGRAVSTPQPLNRHPINRWRFPFPSSDPAFTRCNGLYT
jgi:hypothetical protein